MSAALTKVRRGPAAILKLPRVADPVTGDVLNTAFAAIEQYEAQRPARETNSIPTFAAVRLTSPNGTTWQLTVSDNGSVMVQSVPRT